MAIYNVESRFWDSIVESLVCLGYGLLRFVRNDEVESTRFARLWIATILLMQNLAMTEKYALKANLYYGLFRPLFCAFLAMTQQLAFCHYLRFKGLKSSLE